CSWSWAGRSPANATSTWPTSPATPRSPASPTRTAGERADGPTSPGPSCCTSPRFAITHALTHDSAHHAATPGPPLPADATPTSAQIRALLRHVHPLPKRTHLGQQRKRLARHEGAGQADHVGAELLQRDIADLTALGPLRHARCCRSR